MERARGHRSPNDIAYGMEDRMDAIYKSTECSVERQAGDAPLVLRGRTNGRPIVGAISCYRIATIPDKERETVVPFFVDGCKRAIEELLMRGIRLQNHDYYQCDVDDNYIVYEAHCSWENPRMRDRVITLLEKAIGPIPAYQTHLSPDQRDSFLELTTQMHTLRSVIGDDEQLFSERLSDVLDERY